MKPTRNPIKWLALMRAFSDAAEGVQAKAWYTSRTVWANLLAVVGLLLMNLGIIQGFESEHAEAMAAGLLACINVVLRFMTTTPLAGRTIKGE